MQDFQSILNNILKKAKQQTVKGKVADYIPELSGIDPDKFGIAVLDSERNICSTGDAKEQFSIQSITKVLALSMAMSHVGEELWKRVGVEPSGRSFQPFITPGNGKRYTKESAYKCGSDSGL